MAPLRILIADDHSVIRAGVRAVVEERPGWTICGEAASGSEAIAKTEELKPDVLILDVSLPDMSGLEVASQILSAQSSVEILILSVHATEALIRECVKAGVRGYVVEIGCGAGLVAAVEDAHRETPTVLYVRRHAGHSQQLSPGRAGQRCFRADSRAPHFAREGNRPTACGGKEQ